MKRYSRLLPVLLGLFCSSAFSMIESPHEGRPVPKGIPDEAADVALGHIQTRPLRADQIAPLPAQRDHLFTSYDRPLRRPGVTANCDLGVFASASGSALVDAVRGADLTTCLYNLFDIRGTQAGQTFNEAKMVTIADAFAAQSATYDGTNADRTLQLVMFLRAGYYVAYADAAAVGTYGTSLKSAIRAAFDAFFANPHAADVSQVHGQTLGEIVTLVSSSGENAYALDALVALLGRYGPSYQPYSYMLSAVNNVFSVIYNGHFNADFQTAVQAKAGVVSDTLAAFVHDNRLADVGTGREYLLKNAAGELGRLLKYPSLAPMLRPKIKSVLDLFSLTGPGSGIYVWLANMVTYYDNDQCAYYGLCTFNDDLADTILPPANARECSATLKVRSQALTSAQLDTVCAIVGGEEGYFHTMSATGGIPVANDYNTRLEMVIFHSSSDYETYSGQLFGNNTNNGGIYLEGDPANPNNQARFIAYEAEWLRPTFEVWNLTHEYIHYLDGRFNWHGGFSAYPMTAPYSAIWYIEGFAEFMSYSYRELVYASAVTQAATPGLYSLATLFNTVYDTNYTRTYQWGYLATRFMFERHHNQIDALYALARVGNYSPGYRNWLDPIRTAYDDEFRGWVACFAEHNGVTADCPVVGPDKIFSDGFDTPPPDTTPECTADDVRVLGNGCKRSGLVATAANQRVWLYAYLPAGLSRVKFTMGGGTGDADLYVRQGTWPNDTTFDYAPQLEGNDETVEITAPASGYYYLMLKPRTSWFDGVRVRADWE